ncbi:putative RNA helicase [Helianthus annuus]|uniref:DNA 5'-3' helicase FANCJ n=2 Tax=Helianthus annuus TaxID=4232 RepID=A0A9K3IWN5_HELAN|nr:Fanconi anemia group J protein homolog [Helianthus annuus]KAF5804016.1 putative RNA helicase [Helianthus annuus]KAJ0913598.1 putative RNA helicase [Helianthus annuus]
MLKYKLETLEHSPIHKMKANQRRKSTQSEPVMSNPNPKPHVNHISGIPIEFPYPPYGSQLAYMSRVITTLDRAQRDGHFHALLESPTGTGKSLSLLCSVLAWQKNHRSKSLYGNISHSKPDPEALIDPLGHGGGFVPEMEQPSANVMPTLSETNNGKQKKKRGVVIYYATRTHSQISQVIGEFRKTSYHVPMGVLGSRKRYCTNPKVRDQDNIDEKCKLLLKENKQKKAGCREFMNAQKIRAHPSVKKGGCYEVHDIEDLIKVGEMVQGCSYFGAQAMAEVADIVFCPYSYIVNPQIRKAMEINVKGNIIILDEAHNIEDIAREAGSINVEEGVLFQLQKELENLCQSDQEIYQPLYEMIEGIMSWISLRKNSLGKHSFQHKASCWGADKAVKELQEANISMQCFPSLQDCATKAIKIATDADPEVAHLSGMPCTVLEGLFSSLTYFFSEDGKHICDYQLVLQCHINSDDGLAGDEWPCTFSLWCLNPALVFKNMADSALSVILTSGTLSPMSSFQSELGVQFGTSLEAPHVINVDSQLWAGVIHQGPDNYPLNASYKTSEAYGFQDALGTSLEEICKVVPGGCLVFFPSYKLMDKLRSRWFQTGQWSRLNAQKPVFVEPRGGQDDFEHVLKDYYDTIRNGKKSTTGRRRGKKWDTNSCNATKCKGNSKGATFLAVCRGKVSEGIDFSDDNARTVIIVGIPFPNVFDIQVAEKKKYNDTFKSSKSLLSGSEWYCQQAFRALNQAAGRCIRHRFDYGAIIFLDERFRQEKNLTYISKWIRKSIRQHDNFDQSLEGLKSFFRDVKVENNGSSMKPIDVTPIDVEEPRNWFTDMKNGKSTKPNLKAQRSVSDGVTEPKSTTKPKKSAVMTKEFDCSSPTPMISSPNDIELTVVNETPRENDHEPKETLITETTLKSASEDELSNSTIFHTKFPDQQLPHSFSSPCSTSASGIMHAFVTPNRQHISQNASPLLDTSVNSRFHKRRKPSVVKMEPLDSPETSSTTFGDVMKKDVKVSCSVCKHPLGLEVNNYIVPCSIMSLSKTHLASIWKGEFEKQVMGPTSVPVAVTDITSVDTRIWDRSPEQGIWSKEDGCVFNKIFCTFCSNQDNCLGLRVVATDSSNVHLLNKAIFYSDRLEIQHIDLSRDKEHSPSSVTSGTKSLVQDPFEKYAYVPPETNSGGWRTTKSKMRLPRKV